MWSSITFILVGFVIIYSFLVLCCVVLSFFFFFHKFHTDELETCNNQEGMEQLSTFSGYDKVKFLLEKEVHMIDTGTLIRLKHDGV